MARSYAPLEGEDAAKECAKADAMAKRIMPSLRAEIAVRCARPAFIRGDADRVEFFSRAALQTVDRTEQPYVLANALGMFAAASMIRGDFEQAIARYDYSIRYARVAGATGTASKMLGNVGWSYYKLGDMEQARVSYQQALQAAQAEGDLTMQSLWLGNLAAVCIADQQFVEAVNPARSSVDLARRIGVKTQIAATLSNLAQVEIELRRFNAARKHNNEALALWPDNEYGDERNYALINAARIDAASGNAASALAVLKSLATTTEDLPLRWNAQAFMARIYREHGRSAEAEEMYEAALDTGDLARVESKTQEAYRFTFESNLIHFYDEYIDLLLAAGRSLDALRVAERSRARALRDGLGMAADPNLDPSALARAHGATILWYWLAPKRSLLWIVTGDGVAVESLPAQDVIGKTIDDYRRETQARYDGRTSPRGAALFEMLVRPALAHARTDRFVIIPDGRLNDINLETAVVPTARPHYWIEDATISYAPSLQFLAAAAKRPQLRDGRVLVVGNIPAREGFPALAQAGTEMQNVVRHFNPRQQVLLAGLAATRSAFLNADLRGASFIHFATHSTASVASPLESSVILAGERRLTGRDIAGTRLGAELVTLSSCNSAGRKSYAGEGLVGLAWAFLRAGAHRVVAAQWDVSDAATPKLMDSMYRELANGADPASALRTAKLELLHSSKAYQTPYYWAPFILYGAP